MSAAHKMVGRRQYGRPTQRQAENEPAASPPTFTSAKTNNPTKKSAGSIFELPISAVKSDLPKAVGNDPRCAQSCPADPRDSLDGNPRAPQENLA
jgi:hypothetical protein